ICLQYSARGYWLSWLDSWFVMQSNTNSMDFISAMAEVTMKDSPSQSLPSPEA
ncbi:hypothetical protein H7E98_18100, partial [Proteus mirabilis]|nr:hypothetical protein [Proteus mirabilis]